MTPLMRTLVEHAIAAFVFVGAIFVAGRDILRSMRRKGQYRRAYHGKFVLYWMLLGSFSGMAVAPLVCEPRYVGGLFGFGLLGGWAIGMVHGAILIAVNGAPMPPNETE